MTTPTGPFADQPRDWRVNRLAAQIKGFVAMSHPATLAEQAPLLAHFTRELAKAITAPVTQPGEDPTTFWAEVKAAAGVKLSQPDPTAYPDPYVPLTH